MRQRGQRLTCNDRARFFDTYQQYVLQIHTHAEPTHMHERNENRDLWNRTNENNLMANSSHNSNTNCLDLHSTGASIKRCGKDETEDGQMGMARGSEKEKTSKLKTRFDCMFWLYSICLFFQFISPSFSERKVSSDFKIAERSLIDF